MPQGFEEPKASCIGVFNPGVSGACDVRCTSYLCQRLGNNLRSLYFVNAGGAEETVSYAREDIIWEQDLAGSPSTYFVAGSANVFFSGTAQDMSNISNAKYTEVLFQTERFDALGGSEMTWAFPVVSGRTYIIRLGFSELFHGSVGSRVFSVSVEGSVPSVFQDIDCVDIAGSNFTAFFLEHEYTAADNSLNLVFLRNVDNPKVNTIEILEVL